MPDVARSSKDVRVVQDASYVASQCCSGMKGTLYDDERELHICKECGQEYQDARGKEVYAPSVLDMIRTLTAAKEQGGQAMVEEIIALNVA